MRTARSSVRKMFLCCLGFHLSMAEPTDGIGPYGPGASDVHAIVICGKAVFAGTYGGVFISSLGHPDWTARNSGLADTNVNALKMIGHTLVAGTSHGGIFCSSDSGMSWTSATGIDAHVWAIIDSGPQVFAGTTNGVYRSTDNGKNWTSIGLHGNRVVSLAVFNSQIFAALDCGTIYYSCDTGSHWSPRGFTQRHVNCLATADTILFAGTTIGVVKTSDAGLSWNQLDSCLSDKNISTLAFCAIWRLDTLLPLGGQLYAGTESGEVLFSLNGADWWQNPPFPSLPSVPITAIAITYSEEGWGPEPSGTTYEYYGTSGSGVWGRFTTSVETTTDTSPKEFKLLQNYPNPFNPTTTIDFELVRGGAVTLEVLDLLGRKVETLASGSCTPGRYSLKFYGSKLPSGIYLYRLNLGRYMETRKMLLLR